MVLQYLHHILVYADGAAVFAPHKGYANGAAELQYSKNHGNWRYRGDLSSLIFWSIFSSVPPLLLKLHNVMKTSYFQI